MELHERIRPQWHHAYGGAEDHPVRWVDARDLLRPQRFDLAAKLIFLRAIRTANGVPWARRVYREHLSRWSGGKFVEADGSGKAGFDAYENTLRELLASMIHKGFDVGRSILPVSHDGVIHDGAHRTSVAIELGLRVPTVASEMEAAIYDYRFFQQCGMRDEALDAMALEYCRRATNSYIAYLFPVHKRDDKQAIDHIQAVGSIFYERTLELTRNGLHNLIAQIYRDEVWLGSASNGFAGAESHVKNRFIAGQPLRCIFFQADRLEDVVEAKAYIRAIYKQGNYPVHINDTHAEVVRVAEQVLSETGRHFINHGHPARYPKAHRRLQQFHDVLTASKADPQDYIIDGSFVLAMYGLRDAQDVDYLHRERALEDLPEEFQSHNAELHHYNHDLDEILSAPGHSFFYDGVKLASLPLIQEMKQRRGEAKDIRDVKLIQSLHQPSPWSHRALTEVRYLIRTLPHRWRKLRLRIFTWIPTGAQPMMKRAYRALFKRPASGAGDRTARPQSSKRP